MCGILQFQINMIR